MILRRVYRKLMEIRANLFITLTATYFMLSMCRNMYRLLFMTCRVEGSADEYVQMIYYCCPARQCLVCGVRCDGSDLPVCLIAVKKY